MTIDARDASPASGEHAAVSKILLVDDNTANLQALRELLEGLGCKILVAKSGASALTIVEKARPDLILLDIMMPEMDGYEVCRRLKEDEATSHIPVLFLTALADPEDEARGLALGALDYITKPFHPDRIRARVRNYLELKRYQNHLDEVARIRTRELQLTQAVMIESLATLVQYRDPETGGHIRRTQSYIKALAMHLKNHPRFCAELSDASIELLYLSAPLHDIGKVAMRDDILLKAWAPGGDEFERMKKHTILGHEALRAAERKLGKSDFLRYAREIALTHHERWDGSGYPGGLKGDEIPISGRLMAIADVYDAMVSKRVYQAPLPHEEAVQIIKNGEGTLFDPDVVDALLELEAVFHNIALNYADYEGERHMDGGEKPTLSSAAAGHAWRILLVDDNPINQEMMFSQLTSSGHTVDVASNGREALRKYRAGHYDIILTDIDMPKMDGYELTAEIRRLEKGEGDVTPILAITASDFDLSPEIAKERGFNGLMLKPLDPDALEKKLEALCHSRPRGSEP
jgi:putative two-component system response regulator